MVITPEGLAAAMKAEQGTAQDESLQDDANLTLATAIVNYLKANAVVVGTAGGDAIVGGAIT